MTNKLGSIDNLFLKSRRGELMIEQEKLSLTAGSGIDRDIHANPISPRQVLIVRQEDLAQHNIVPSALGENIVITGVNVDWFVPGSVIKFDRGAAIRLTFYCEPCKQIAHLVTSLKSIAKKRGILGVVITGGSIATGDRLEIQPDIFPALSDIPYERFLNFLTKIPAGKVVTYRQIIDGIGVSPGYFRALPKYLEKALAADYPVHRILDSQGALTSHVPHQRELLASEGVLAIESGGSLEDYLWDAPAIYVSVEQKLRKDDLN
jgi:alkylated DNA nucleotide flippase Atl1